ncbi:MAG: pentapeptide repeat-containing protein [Chloroflexi bacterium]|nr:pentapeptide repeat-containing protein [Chloroflexota bacterium]
MTDTTLTGANFTGANLDRANRANEDATASNRWRLVCLADLDGVAGLDTVQGLSS